MATYQYEDSLPELPVPPLSSTINQLLVAIKPLVSVDEYNELLNESSEFLNHPLISQIQQHLTSVSKKEGHHCYLNSINDETNPGIYGDLRGDILPRNPYLVLQEDPYSKFMNPPNQQQRAASLINSSLKFIISLRHETLKPDVTPKNGNPLTMNCYKNLFGTTRVPKVDSIDNYHHIQIQKCPDSQHIVVISHNQFYKIEVLNGDNEIYFNDYDMSLILQDIIIDSEKFDAIDRINNAIGSLTTQNYNYWRLSRVELSKSNLENLQAIDDALFVVVLDDNTPTTDQEKTQCISHGSSKLDHNVQVGSCTSRWYDKLQIIVTANSVAGIVWESTSMDSTAILRFISDIYTDLILKLAKNINAIEYSLFGEIKFVSNKLSSDKPNYERLVINKTPELLNLIHLSETRLADLINQHLYTTIKLKFDVALLSKLEISIDSVIQICLQITNYSLYGKISNTLEPITTRKFRDARTELIAVQNDDITNLVKLFITTSSKSKKWELFNKCCKIHTAQYLNAMKGKGFERHLTSLLHITNHPKASKFLNSINKELPPLDFEALSTDYLPILSNNVLSRILTPELLISNCGNPALYLFGIPPAVDQGFGIGYIVHTDKVLLTLSSKFRQNDRFLHTLHKIVNEVKIILMSKSDLLDNINRDNSYRSYEVQRLRFENELKNLNIDSAATKHPIELSVGQATISYDNKSPRFEISESSVNTPLATPGERPQAPSTHQLPYQSSQLSGNPISTSNFEDPESFGSSPMTNSSSEFDYLGGYGYFDFGELDLRNSELNNSNSYLHSPALSSHQSQVNLRADLKNKFDLNERIREKLNKSVDDLKVEKEDRPKHEIGRPLNM